MTSIQARIRMEFECSRRQLARLSEDVARLRQQVSGLRGQLSGLADGRPGGLEEQIDALPKRIAERVVEVILEHRKKS